MKKKNNKYCDFCGIEIESGTFCFGCFDLFLRHKLTKEDEYTKAVLLADVHKETCSICTGRDECPKNSKRCYYLSFSKRVLFPTNICKNVRFAFGNICNVTTVTKLFKGKNRGSGYTK